MALEMNNTFHTQLYILDLKTVAYDTQQLKMKSS